MEIIIDHTDGSDGMLSALALTGPPQLRGQYCAYTITGKALPGEHRFRIGATLACHGWGNARPSALV
ncbi:MAG TPA: hypothetical protein VJU82_06335, partial [Acidobacteriaceae bacterium]|nr:hypothetical protein [Acidobacteriaceae bacterium]